MIGHVYKRGLEFHQWVQNVEYSINGATFKGWQDFEGNEWASLGFGNVFCNFHALEKFKDNKI